MNLGQIKEEIRAIAAGETTSVGSHWNTDNDTFMLDAWINEGYGIVLDSQRWPFLKRESWFSTFYTVLAADKAIGATSIDVDTLYSNLLVGDWIYIIHGSIYYPHIVTAINYTTKAVSISPALTVAVTDGDHVAKFDYALAYDVKTLISLYDQTNLKTLSELTQQEFDKDYIVLRAEGEPDKYVIYSNYSITESGLTANAGTTTTSIVDTGLKGGIDDYYNGWLVNGQSRVTDTGVSAGTVTLTLEKAISGMTTGTAYTLTCDLPRVKIYPLPNGYYNIGDTYFARLPELSNASDAPQFGPDGEKYQRLLVTFGRARAMEESGDPGAGAVMQEFYANLGRMTQDLMGHGRSKGRLTFRLQKR